MLRTTIAATISLKAMMIKRVATNGSFMQERRNIMIYEPMPLPVPTW
jgi:hypothetical protein